MRRLSLPRAAALCLTTALSVASFSAQARTVAPTSPAPPAAPAKPADVEKSGLVPTIKPQVEIVFALDTTGSMGGLIDGAKRKIWAIANEVARAEQQPNVRIGLVAYRDRGDAYVTQTFDLSDDLDDVYTKLMSFSANGGGDGPEDVNSALHDAVHKMSWSKEKKTLKMVFLVGDAEPHMDYEQQVQWTQTVKDAVRQNIYVNTVQCGTDGRTTTVWKDIAHAAEGRFAMIPQDGGVRVAVTTPFDAELSRLAVELDGTNLTYGHREERARKVAARSSAGSYAAAAPMAASAERAIAKNSFGSGMKASEDLVSLAAEKGDAAAALKDMKEAELPDELRGKSKEEQAKIVATNQARRAEIQKQITELSKKRARHLEEAARKAPAPAADSFDSEVKEMMHAEGAEVGLSW